MQGRVASLAICFPGVYLYAGITASQLASAMYPVPVPLLFTFLMSWHQQHLLQSGKSGPTWGVRPGDTDLRVDEHKKTCVLNKRSLVQGRFAKYGGTLSSLRMGMGHRGRAHGGQTCEASHVL